MKLSVHAGQREDTAGRADPGDRQRSAQRQGRDARERHGGGRPLDRSAQLDQEQQRRARPRDEAKPGGQQCYFGMKCHIGVDADSGLVHAARGTSGAINDAIEANSLGAQPTIMSTPTPATRARAHALMPGAT